MKKILLFLVLLVLFLIPCRVYSQSVGELQQQIDDLTQKVTDLQNQGKTLASQITYMDSQIKLTTLKITQTQSQIDDLTLKIGRLEVSLDQMSVILKSRIAAAYEQGQPNVLSLFFSSSK
ncbi:hypothetical protein COY13_00180, partial [Candidatus Roizmanbacteria bacterium CG_4_10_14_0_2_um_filter_36_35]